MQQSLSRRRLPDGIQDFRTIREGGYYYVDKTPLITQLVDEGRHYFLSRPRRFGKSLLVDTIKSLFEGREELFRGLAVHDRWDWSARNPVLRLSFGAKYGESGDLQGSILNKLRNIEETADLPKKLFDSSGPEYLENLLINLHRKSGRQVVVLVDEYDKPILDALIDPNLAEKNRDYLRGFYGVIKDNAEHVRFVLVTGVSMFTKVSLFSGLNNLKNISLNPRYSSICGFTEEELDAVFAPELEGLDRDEVRRWYNGYSWRGGEKVYNPHDVLLLFDEREFESHWFETGSPAVLLDLLVRRKVDPMSLENRVAKSDLISRFDIDGIEVEALMFQSGYLTIVGEERRKRGRMFTLDYPNQEVRQSLSSSLLKHVTDRDLEAESRGEELGDLLAANDFAGFAERLQAYLSGVPHQWYDAGEVERFEAHYASMLFMAFRAVGMDMRLEDASRRGRSDMTLLHEGQVFVLEFKVAQAGGDAGPALAQMRERGYADKYRDRNEPVHLVALAFGRGERNLVGIRTEPA